MNYMPYDDGSGAAPMDDEDFHWQQPQAAPHAGEAQDGAAAHAGASRVNESQLPSTEDLHLWLAAIVERDGLEKLLEALLSVARRADVMRTIEQLCDVRFSIEPIQQLEDGQEVPATCTARSRPLPPSLCVTGSPHTRPCGRLRRRRRRDRRRRPRTPGCSRGLAKQPSATRQSSDTGTAGTASRGLGAKTTPVTL